MTGRKRNLARGFVGGAAGLVAMQLVDRLARPFVKPRAAKPTDVFESERTISPFGALHHPDEGATDAIARIAFAKLVGREPAPRVKQALSLAVHVVYGLAVGAAYGAARPRSRHPIRDGVLFGALLWLLGDELATSLLGLSDKPTMYSASRHAKSLAEHVGYGVALGAIV